MNVTESKYRKDPKSLGVLSVELQKYPIRYFLATNVTKPSKTKILGFSWQCRASPLGEEGWRAFASGAYSLYWGFYRTHRAGNHSFLEGTKLTERGLVVLREPGEPFLRMVT